MPTSNAQSAVVWAPLGGLGERQAQDSWHAVGQILIAPTPGERDRVGLREETIVHVVVRDELERGELEFEARPERLADRVVVDEVHVWRPEVLRLMCVALGQVRPLVQGHELDHGSAPCGRPVRRRQAPPYPPARTWEVVWSAWPRRCPSEPAGEAEQQQRAVAQANARVGHLS